MDTIPTNQSTKQDALALLKTIAERLEQLDERLDDFCRAHLNARFPYGKPTDRWRR